MTASKPRRWDEVPFGGLVLHSAFGPRFSGNEYAPDGNVATLRTTDLDQDGRISYDTMPLAKLHEGNFESHFLRPNDLVISRSGTCGITAVFKEFALPVLPGAFLIRFRLNERADPHFFRYYFNSPVGRARVMSTARGAVQQNLNITSMEALHVPLPPLSQQRRTADILSAYDDLIENNRRRMELLEESARRLYQEWFVRLRFPGHEHTHIADGIPENWERVTIAELIERGEIELQTGPFGTQLKASDYTEEGAPVINVRNIGFGDVRPEKLEFVPDHVVERLHQHVLKAGDIVFGRKGAVDRHVLIRSSQDGWVQGSDCIRMRSLSERISTLLLSLAFREAAHKEWMLTQCSNKATMASLNQSVLGRIITIVPSHSILLGFLGLASVNLEQIGVLERQSERARAARDLLLPRLMSGEVTV